MKNPKVCLPGGRSEADHVGVEVLEDAAIFRDVVVLTAETQFGIGHLAVKEITSVALIDHHEIVLID